MNETKQYTEAISGLSDKMYDLLNNLPDQIKSTTKEIRLRFGRPVCVITQGGGYFIKQSGEPTKNYKHDLYITNKNDISESFRVLCNYSVHSYIEEIKQGFITISGGHRAGICGTAIVQNDQISNIKDIGSINLRVARQVVGVADNLVKEIFKSKIGGTLIVGAPASGKTTMLKDIILNLSLNKNNIAVVDSRGEIAASHNGKPQNNLGPCTDVLDGYPKGEGMMIAIRTMAPDAIVCDEIGDIEDAQAVCSCLNAGVSVIVTAHASSVEELVGRKHIIELIKVGAFENIVFLQGKDNPCMVKDILKAGDIYDKVCRHDYDNNF